MVLSRTRGRPLVNPPSRVLAERDSRPVDSLIRKAAESSYASCLTADYVSYDDLPWADEQVIRAHAAELIAMAESFGLANLRYASANRIVVTLTDQVATFGDYRFAEQASFLLGRQVRAYDDEVLKNPGVSPDLLAATPL